MTCVGPEPADIDKWFDQFNKCRDCFILQIDHSYLLMCFVDMYHIEMVIGRAGVAYAVPPDALAFGG